MPLLATLPAEPRVTVMSWMNRVANSKSVKRLSWPPSVTPWWPVERRRLSGARSDVSEMFVSVTFAPRTKMPLSALRIATRRTQQLRAAPIAIAFG